MLSWIAVHEQADHIEHDLERRAGGVLAAAGHDWASVDFSGRNGILVGTAAHADAAADALSLARGVWGVRRVGARTRIAGEEIASEMPTGDARAVASPEQAATQVREGVNLASVSDAHDLSALRPDRAALADLRPSAAAGEVGRLDIVIAHEPKPAPAPAGEADGSKSPPGRKLMETAAIAEYDVTSLAGCPNAARAVAGAGPIFFERGKIALDRRGRQLLDRLGALVEGCPHLGLKVVGHADADGARRRNLRLSRRRARAAVAYLKRKGIDAGRLEAVGFGEARPAAPNDTAQNRARNRRIEVEVTRLAPAPD